MKIVYQPQLNIVQNACANEIARALSISYDTAKLLFCRGIDSVDKAKRYLSPGKKWFNNPILLDGVESAVKRIKIAKENNEKVLIYGDYDADGICATSLTYFCLKEFGIDCLTLIPERADGYGLNVELIERTFLDEKIDLIITVDCGVSDAEKIEILKDKGIEVIVTDHHIPPEILPKCITINPKISGQKYPFDKLCGAGVAYKLCSAIIGEQADKYLDFVALATVADSMDLVEENRDIVFEGLKIFNSKSVKLPFSYLLSTGVKKINSQTLAYSIAPKVNAGGRMGDAKCALDLFLSTNAKVAYEHAVKLVDYNLERQAECENIYVSAKELITKNRLDDYEVIVVASKDWKIGLTGIVASKLVEDYNKPVIVFAYQNEYFKGSARSLGNLDIFDVINSAKHLTVDFGGHSGAAGVTLKEENIDAFRAEISKYVADKNLNVSLEKEIFVDVLLEKELSIQFATEIDMMEPFGVANRKPLFAVKENALLSKPLKEGSVHYYFNTKAVQILDFNGEHNVYGLSLPTYKTLIFEPNVSVFNGKISLKGYLKKIVNEFDGFMDLRYHAFYQQLLSVSAYNDYSENVEYIPYKNVTINGGIGTLYVLSNAENYYKYDLEKLEKFYLKDDSQNCVNKLIFAPDAIPEGYKTVVYLDKPMCFLHTTAKVFCVDITDGSMISKVSVLREDMARCFTVLSSFNGVEINDIVSFLIDNNIDDLEQMIFAFAVFNELGFFTISNGKFIKLDAPKNALTNSSLYCKISNIKG